MMEQQYDGAAIFQGFYQDALVQNPLYCSLIAGMQRRENWSESDWRNAVDAVYEYECFLQALHLAREASHGNCGQWVKENEFVLYRSQF